MKKTAIGLICKKTICTCSTRFFAFFLPLFCTTTTWNFQKLPGYPLNGGNVVRVLVQFFFLFFTSLMFTLVEASISHFLTAATKFHVVPRTKNVSFAFFSLSSSFPRWALLACRPTFCFLYLSPPFSIFQIVGMTINLSLIYQTTHRNIFLFRLFNIDSLVAFAS